MDPGFVHSLQAESWSLYAVAVLAFSLRLFTRVNYLGVKRDDFMMVFAMSTYTALLVSMNLIVVGGGSNLFPPDEWRSFTPEQVKDRIKGSKIVLVSEQAMLLTIWSVKACVLTFYLYLTSGLHARRAVQALVAYVAVGFLACETAFFTACRPFNGYWAVPPPNSECTTFVHYAIVNAVFNISSDIVMIIIPLPLLITSRLPLRQKAAVCGVFCMGFFVIIAAILTKVFNLSDIYNPVYIKWYIREASVAVYVANTPAIWPLIRRVVPGFGSVESRSITCGHSGLPCAGGHCSYGGHGGRGGGPGGHGGSCGRAGATDLELSLARRASRNKCGGGGGRGGGDAGWESESTENMVEGTGGDLKSRTIVKGGDAPPDVGVLRPPPTTARPATATTTTTTTTKKREEARMSNDYFGSTMTFGVGLDDDDDGGKNTFRI